jgi:C4-dicarboxylate-specific signal transduction histidine kinase
VLAEQRAKDAVEVKRREARDARHVVERQRLRQVAGDVVDRAVDAVDVVEVRKI